MGCVEGGSNTTKQMQSGIRLFEMRIVTVARVRMCRFKLNRSHWAGKRSVWPFARLGHFFAWHFLVRLPGVSRVWKTYKGLLNRQKKVGLLDVRRSRTLSIHCHISCNVWKQAEVGCSPWMWLLAFEYLRIEQHVDGLLAAKCSGVGCWPHWSHCISQAQADCTEWWIRFTKLHTKNMDGSHWKWSWRV